MTARLPVDAPHAEFMAAVRARNLAGLDHGVAMGWWPSHDGDAPHPWPIKAAASDHRSMAHLLASLGVFPSVGDARRNGWGKPCAAGTYRVGRRVIEVLP